jgi:hypothetical protein
VTAEYTLGTRRTVQDSHWPSWWDMSAIVEERWPAEVKQAIMRHASKITIRTANQNVFVLDDIYAFRRAVGIRPT